MELGCVSGVENVLRSGESGIPFPFFSNSAYNLTLSNNFLYRSQVQLYLTPAYCSSAPAYITFTASLYRFVVLRPGETRHFYDLTFLVKSVPSVRIILCHIAILHRYRDPVSHCVSTPSICPPTILRNVRASHQCSEE